MALQLPPLVQPNRGLDLSQQIASFFQQRRKTQEAEKIAKAELAIRNTTNLAVQFQSIRDIDDPNLQRRALFRLAQEEEKAGRDSSKIMQAAGLDKDDRNVFLTRQATLGLSQADKSKSIIESQKPKTEKRTSLQQNLIAAGFTPGTPEFEVKLEELISRPIGTTVNVGTGGFKVPAGFMLNPDDPTGQSVIPIPGGKGAVLSGEGAKLEEISRGGLVAVAELKTMLDSGNITQETLAAATTPGMFNFFKTANVQEFETLRADLTDMIGRLRSGGAINKEELATFIAFLPVFGDKDSVMKNKLKRLKEKFKNISSKVSLAPITKETAPTIIKFDAQGNQL